MILRSKNIWLNEIEINECCILKGPIVNEQMRLMFRPSLPQNVTCCVQQYETSLGLAVTTDYLGKKIVYRIAGVDRWPVPIASLRSRTL
jgi:hypothetical protein